MKYAYDHINSLLLFPLLFFGHLSFAQSHMIDSLQNKLKNSTGDSQTVFILSSLAHESYAYDTVKSYEFMQKASALADKMKWDYAIGNNYLVRGIIRQLSSDHDLAHLLIDSAIVYFKKVVDKPGSVYEVKNCRLGIATALGQKADILIKKGKGEEAIPVFLSALELWKASDDSRKNQSVGTYYEKIATAYYEMKQFQKALFYDKLSLSMHLTTTNEEAVAWAYVYVCDDFAALKNADSSLFYLAKAKPLVEQLNNHRLNVQYYSKLAGISREKKEYLPAIVNYQKVITEATITNTKFQILAAQRWLGFCYMKLGKYDSARKYSSSALLRAIAGNYIQEKIWILESLATVESNTGHASQAYTYLKEMTVLKDSFNMANTTKAMTEIETRYQGVQKEKDISKLKVEKEMQALTLRQRASLNYFLTAAIVGLLITGFLAYRNMRHRQLLSRQDRELQQQHIRELEKDKQLVAVDSMLKGQENERTRMARDLHDGLGGMLSGVKFSLSNMKDNLIITPDNMTVFERSLDMIDTSIRELRRVAQNMMPEMLVKFGLDEALKDYTQGINATGVVNVRYQSFGLDARLDSSVEISIYRIIQELLNNIMKHAGATEAVVQLVKEENRLNIMVEDNGKGFDPAILEKNTGAGWTNIRSRVNYLKGQLEIYPEPGKGTSVNIELNV